MENLTVKEGKLLAIVSHFWLLGTIIAWVLNLKKQNGYTNFYVRQMLGLNILFFLNSAIVFYMLGGFVRWIFSIVLIVFWFISILGAISDEKKLIPFFGEHFQDWFKSL